MVREPAAAGPSIQYLLDFPLVVLSVPIAVFTLVFLVVSALCRCGCSSPPFATGVQFDLTLLDFLGMTGLHVSVARSGLSVPVEAPTEFFTFLFPKLTGVRAFRLLEVGFGSTGNLNTNNATGTWL
jgi:hypothetical protein